MRLAIIALLSLALSGCGCTSSYWESLATLGIGYQYCGKNWSGDHRCMKPAGRDDRHCACNEKSPCKQGKPMGSLHGDGCCCCN